MHVSRADFILSASAKMPVISSGIPAKNFPNSNILAWWLRQHLPIAGALRELARTIARQSKVSLGSFRATEISIPPLTVAPHRVDKKRTNHKMPDAEF
jgi:hypothetical protein